MTRLLKVPRQMGRGHIFHLQTISIDEELSDDEIEWETEAAGGGGGSSEWRRIDE